MMRVNPAAMRCVKLLRKIQGRLLMLVCALPARALAAEFASDIDIEPTQNSALAGGIQTDYIVQVLLSLLLVVGIIVLLSFLLKKINLQARTGSGAVRILTVVPLGAKDRLLLVAVGEEQLLLGASPGGVQKLHTLNKPIDPSLGREPAAEQGSFLSVLNSVTRGQRS